MLCAVLVCCCGCNWNPFVKHPYLYGDSVWVCENPKITYVVEMKYDDEQEMDMPQTYAVTNVDGKEILFELLERYETEDNTYVAITEYRDDETEIVEADFEVIILKVVEDKNGDEYLEEIQDDNEYEQVSDILMAKVEQKYDVEYFEPEQ